MSTLLDRYRLLRVGEVMQATDKLVNAFGCLEPVRDSMVGHKVLGNRYGPDHVLRLRKRRATSSLTPTPTSATL